MTRASIDFRDFLIVGSGIAGLRAAIALAPAGQVLILTKADPTESNTGYAQGGIAAAIGRDDSPELHGADTMHAGDGLCDEAAVRILVEEGPGYVRELMSWGVRFDRADDGEPALALEAAHTVRRVLHAGDATGREIGRALWEHARAFPSIAIVKHALVTELVVIDGSVRGLRYFDESGVRREVHGKAVLLATGGAGQVFRETTNPGVATGDGVALAYEAGARVADLEFVQFHPTALSLSGAPRFLISEALRGEGARLVNASGEPFMLRYHTAGDLAPRDVVARSIALEADATGGAVYLTLAHLNPAKVRARFPTIAEMCGQLGLDIATDRIPVGPAAHYLMGGIATDVWGRSSLPGLFAAGETACTGVHGANRLASNSLLEGLVFGARSAKAMQEPGSPRAMAVERGAFGAWRLASTKESPSARRPSGVDGDAFSADAVRDLMWRAAGLFRTRAGLQPALATLESQYARQAELLRGDASFAGSERWRQFNLLSVARLITRAALRREESRGGHFREDFPRRDDRHWQFHAVEDGPAD